MPIIPLFSSKHITTVELPTITVSVTAEMSSVDIFQFPAVSMAVKAFMSMRGFSLDHAKILFFLVIEGVFDGLGDVTIPISSFQARRRSGDPTYLSVVIPTVDYADDISDRSNGDMVIYQAYEIDGEIKQREEILRTDIEDIRLDEGSSSQSVTLTGYKQKIFSPKTVSLSGLTYKSTIGGKRHYRLATPYIFLNPGDTVEINDETIDIGVMSYSVSATAQQFEIEEA